jgi:C-terminal processing protease CtpA/Prc
VNGAPAPLALEDQERTISGATPQWIRVRAIGQLLSGPPGSQLTLGVERRQASRRQETVTVTRQREPFPFTPPLPPVATLAEGVMYADLTRLDDKALEAALPRLAQADGLVFDVRGDPAASDPHLLFRHLAQAPLTSGEWLIPEVTRPDRVRMTFVPDPGWSFAPQAPYLAGRKVFLSDARAVGAAESYLEIVEHYRLGDIVGAPTAGTQGARNRISLPGGFGVSFTGTKVLKHGGAPQHGIGIQPTVAVTRTRAAIAEGGDELIARALALLRAPG